MRLTALNDTALVLSWEPPLVVWQNYSIEEYNITVQNLLGLQVFVVPAKNESQLVLTSKSLMSTEICQKLSIVITAVIAVDGRMLTSETQLSDFPQCKTIEQKMGVLLQCQGIILILSLIIHLSPGYISQ